MIGTSRSAPEFSRESGSGKPPFGDVTLFREKIAPGAFTLEDPAYLLWSHDAAKPLASTGNGSLELQDTPSGLKFSATLPSTQAANDALENVRSGLVKGVSFGFTVQDDDWLNDDRTVTAARLSEISLVTWPAYKSNIAEARIQKQNLQEFFSERKGRNKKMKNLDQKVDRFFAQNNWKN
jgi:HK97 family phage prohead protease